MTQHTPTWHTYPVNVGNVLESEYGEQAYEVSTHVGQGADGNVFAVKDLHLKAPFALKFARVSQNPITTRRRFD